MPRNHWATDVPTTLEEVCATPGAHVYTYFAGACLLTVRDVTGGHLGADEQHLQAAWARLQLRSGLDLDLLEADLSHLIHDRRWPTWAAMNWSQIDLVALGDLVSQAQSAESRRLGGIHYSPRRELEHVVEATFLADFREAWQAIAASTNTRDAASQQARDLLTQLARL
ncbi:MAG: hypothetical protein ACPG4T_17075, partial [Nannocystaceae bacterium]